MTPIGLDIEVRPSEQSRHERALENYATICQWVKTVENWQTVARAYIALESGEWDELGYASWNECLDSLRSSERSRSYLYMVANLYRKQLTMIPGEDGEGIKLGSVTILEQVSPRVRKHPKILEAAKDRPEKLREVLEREFPEQHIETTVNKRCKFPRSMWENTIEPKFETFLMIEPNANFESFIEWLCTEDAHETAKAE
jgi:hypothetical protein